MYQHLGRLLLKRRVTPKITAAQRSVSPYHTLSRPHSPPTPAIASTPTTPAESPQAQNACRPALLVGWPQAHSPVLPTAPYLHTPCSLPVISSWHSFRLLLSQPVLVCWKWNSTYYCCMILSFHSCSKLQQNKQDLSQGCDIFKHVSYPSLPDLC